MKKNNKKGFTLTELIVVIVIIGILAAVLIPSITGYVKKAKVSTVQQESSAIVTAYKTWEAERDELTDETGKSDFSIYLSANVEMELNADAKLEKAYAKDATDKTVVDWKNGFIYTSGKYTDIKFIYYAATGELVQVK